jgi:hypothetical protein
MQATTHINFNRYKTPWRGVIDNPLANQMLRLIPIVGECLTEYNKYRHTILFPQPRNITARILLIKELHRETRYEIIGQLVKMIAYSILLSQGMTILGVAIALPFLCIATVRLHAYVSQNYVYRNRLEEFEKEPAYPPIEDP